LTQVLADGTNTYLYGLERIAQSNLTTEYFLTDALGSARQLVDAGGDVQSAVSYAPFGAPLTDGNSSYGFAGEWQDPTGLVYLRARFYSPELGIFLSRDPFPGFLTQPASLSPYQYAFNNPVRYTDPSGENPLLLVGLLGGLLGGAIYGYGSQVLRNYNSGEFSECPWDIFTANIDAGQIAFYAVAGTLLGLGIAGVIVGVQALAVYLGYISGSSVAIWSSPWYGRQIINGLEYTVHALERMMPVGFGGRGIPPSVVENAIKFGSTTLGNVPGTLMHIYENVIVITDLTNQVIITVIKIGH
jgi:RHS repeat-associated protein